jgi:hypothetical protein
MVDDGYHCATCGDQHGGLVFALGADAPAYWTAEMPRDGNDLLGGENCVIGGEFFFVRATLDIHVHDAGEHFRWIVWVSLSEKNYERTEELWTTEGRENEPPYFGWLASELPGYASSTLGLKTNVHTQPVGIRPVVELEPTDHPLAIEERDGITLARVSEIEEAVRHAWIGGRPTG